MTTLSSTDTQQVESPAGRACPSAEEFEAAIRYVLVHERGMPDLVADSVMRLDAGFIERRRTEQRTTPLDVVAIADELVMQPNVRARWVDRNADPHQESELAAITITSSIPIDRHLDMLVELGLHGEDRQSVAQVVFVRGIEALLPLALALNPSGKAKSK